jgi:hypothetical protein
VKAIAKDAARGVPIQIEQTGGKVPASWTSTTRSSSM